MNPNNLTINDLIARAEAVRDKYKETCSLNLSIFAYRHGDAIQAPTIEYRLHSVGDGEASQCVCAASLEECESQLEAALNPANRVALKLAEAEKLETQAKALRAEVENLQTTK